MEIDHPQNYEQIVSNSDDQVREEQVRAYTCTFCQRGFSNAQALGGHMNIHRKDRTRLKETEEERLTILSADMARKNPLIHPQPSAEKFKLSQLESSEDKDCALKRPLSSLSGVGNISPTGMEKLQQLSLFSEKPSQGINDEKARCYGSGGHGDDENINIRPSHRGGSSQKEILDLELRLGPQPHKTSASIIRGFNQ